MLLYYRAYSGNLCCILAIAAGSQFRYIVENAMRVKFAALSTIGLAIAMTFTSIYARAAEVIALKSGETAEIGNLFWVANCRSLLNGPMTVEVLEGPPDVTASIKDQKIVPHAQNCAKPVAGGVLLLTAPKEVKERKQAKLILRVKYPTVDGERQKGHDIDLTLVP
jgi:hypothetical protein